MAVREYIGARYIPRFTGPYDVTQQYDALDVVDNGSGTSYIARKTVPPGTPLTNTDYWFVYGASSGAIYDLQTRMDAAENNIAANAGDIDAIEIEQGEQNRDITALENFASDYVGMIGITFVSGVSFPANDAAIRELNTVTVPAGKIALINVRVGFDLANCPATDQDIRCEMDLIASDTPALNGQRQTYTYGRYKGGSGNPEAWNYPVLSLFYLVSAPSANDRTYHLYARVTNNSQAVNAGPYISTWAFSPGLE